jgi:hypothetical protein
MAVGRRAGRQERDVDNDDAVHGMMSELQRASEMRRVGSRSWWWKPVVRRLLGPCHLDVGQGC